MITTICKLVSDDKNVYLTAYMIYGKNLWEEITLQMI